ncbi:hypothetical protein BH20ACT24_BH20ACT24_13830 [soil metagenome]
MALALVQVGLLVKDQLIVVGAARAGAREAAVTSDDASVTQAVLDAAPSLDPARVEVRVAREGGVGTAANVQVTYHASVAIPLVQWLFPSSIDLSGTGTMRQETG